MPFRLSAFLAAFVLFAAPAAAHDFKGGDLKIGHPWAGVPFSDATPVAVFFTIENKGAEEDVLLAAKANVSEAVELHETVREGDVASMRKVEKVSVPAGETVKFKHGGLHVMLIGMNQHLKLGDEFPMTLTFEKAGDIDVVIYVEEGGGDHSHH